MTTSTAKDSIGSDSVRLYLSEIGQVPLLTADEEKDLGKKIKAGLVAQEKLNSSDGELSFAERRKLQRTAKDGEKAKDHMVRANLRL
ncbi:MAG: RNA polymerase subunit sigma, partial [Acidimicrobiia bacterium]|nr:RNA polymerase subunit sigma [Acidimicrobiia bacterium]